MSTRLMLHEVVFTLCLCNFKISRLPSSDNSDVELQAVYPGAGGPAGQGAAGHEEARLWGWEVERLWGQSSNRRND